MDGRTQSRPDRGHAVYDGSFIRPIDSAVRNKTENN